MSRSNNNNSASINFNINVPCSVIKEYFNGMAKVEEAKNKNSVNFSSLLSLLPLLLEKEKVESEEKQPNFKVKFVKENKEEKEEKEEEKEPVSLVLNLMGNEECEKEEEKEKEIKKKIKPAYEEDNEMSFDFGKMKAGLEGKGGLGDMMKMFAPMLQELTSGIGNMTQTEEKSEELVSE